MTTPTNWPNPEQPGVPMFPERDGAHAFEYDNDSDLLIVYHWDSKESCWLEFPKGSRKEWDKRPDLDGIKYHGPVLTPTQINEMLAAERESDLHCALMDSAYVSGMKVGWNCAQNDDSARYNSIKEKILQDRIDSGFSFSERSKAIRDLGSAP